MRALSLVRLEVGPLARGVAVVAGFARALECGLASTARAAFGVHGRGCVTGPAPESVATGAWFVVTRHLQAGAHCAIRSARLRNSSRSRHCSLRVLQPVLLGQPILPGRGAAVRGAAVVAGLARTLEVSLASTARRLV